MLEIFLPDVLEWEHDPDNDTITREDWMELQEELTRWDLIEEEEEENNSDPEHFWEEMNGFTILDGIEFGGLPF